jgi:alpha-glucosidase
MPWQDGPGGGFTRPGVKPWLPFGDLAAYNVEAQRPDAGSILNFTRDLMAFRRKTPDLHGGDYSTLPSPPDTWVWRRGAETVVAINFSDGRAELAGIQGRVAFGTDSGRRGASVAGRLPLGPWEAVIVVGS